MNLLKRLKFALTYDIEEEFIVYSIPDQTAMRFLHWDGAIHFSNSQPEYSPKIMVSVHKDKS